MNTSSRDTFFTPTGRDAFLSLLNTALRINEDRFSRQAALAWLAVFPGDLLVTCLLAESYLNEGRLSQAVPILEKLCEQDPEFLKAQELLAATRPEKGSAGLSDAQAHAYALRGKALPDAALPDWLHHVIAGQKALQVNDLEEAEKMARKALVANNTSPLPGIHHARITRATGDFQALQNLADLYHRRWPDCLQFSLYLAESLLENGDENQAVALLHQCAARDAAGQVPERIWGANHPYKPLWPDTLEIFFDLPIPAAVAAVMGWNRLQPGSLIVDNPPAATENSALPAADPSAPQAGGGENRQAQIEEVIWPGAANGFAF